MKEDKKFKPKGSWRAKMEKPQEITVQTIKGPWVDQYGGDQMLISSPMEINETLRKIPQGHLISMGKLRNRLAAEHEADFTCPLTTGIFARIVAETAEEDREKGMEDITPYWRLIKDDGTLNPKFPGGEANQARLLREEGFILVPKGRSAKLMVRDFENYLL